MPEAPGLVVVAQSARALASSARRAGYRPLAIDVFGDEDLCAVSQATIRLEGGLSQGLRSDAVIDSVRSFVRLYDAIGVVYGSGFENQPEIVAALARETRVYGADAARLSRAKDPSAVAQACTRSDVAHPQIAFERPTRHEGWIVKSRGGAGGGHIRPATPTAAIAPGDYFQRRVPGRSISALFAGDGASAYIVGLSEQWPAPSPRSAFRYGGAVGPVDIGVSRRCEIERAVACMTREFGLVGLASADFVVSDDVAWLIELNPRPGATLDVFDCEDDPLLALHMQACNGRMTAPVARSAPKAAGVVYASRDFVCRPLPDWPDWTADRPAAGTRITADDPICTVCAAAPDVVSAKRLISERRQYISSMVEAWTA